MVAPEVEILHQAGEGDSGEGGHPRRPPRWAIVAVVAAAGLTLVSSVLAGGGGDDQADAPAPTIQQPPPPSPLTERVPGPVVPVDLSALPVPVVLASGEAIAPGLWVLDERQVQLVAGARPADPGNVVGPDVQWWGDLVAYVDVDGLRLVDPGAGQPPRGAGSAEHLIPSDGRDHLWAVRDQAAGAVDRFDARSGDVVGFGVPYGTWVAIGAGGGLVSVDAAGRWSLQGDDGEATPLGRDAGPVPFASRAGYVYFVDPPSPTHLQVAVVDVAHDRLVAHHDLSTVAPSGFVSLVCPSPDGSRYAVDLGERLAVVRTDRADVVVDAVFETSTAALAWAGPEQLLHLGPVPPGTAPGSAQQLGVLDLAAGGTEPSAVAQAVGAGPWAIATPDGTC